MPASANADNNTLVQLVESAAERVDASQRLNESNASSSLQLQLEKKRRSSPAATIVVFTTIVAASSRRSTTTASAKVEQTSASAVKRAAQDRQFSTTRERALALA